MVNKAKKVALGAATLGVAFMMSAGITLAQTASPSPTASPSASPTIPSAAPSTGLGG